MDSWRSVSVPDLPGSVPGAKDLGHGQRRAGGRGGPGARPRCMPAVSPRTTQPTSVMRPRSWPGICLSVPGVTRGSDVSYVQNVTDVDDPLLERADRDGEDWRELAAREIALYRSDMAALRVLPLPSYVGRGRGDAADRGVQRGAGRPRLAVRGRRRRVLLPLGRSGLRLGVRARPGGDDPAVRRERRRSGPAGQEGPGRSAGLAGGAARRAILAVGVRPRQARLACGVRGDRDPLPGRARSTSRPAAAT